MAKLSAATEHALSLLAHAAMAKSLAGNVEGYSGFYDFWLAQQAPKDRQILDQYARLAIAARKDLLKMLQSDQNKKEPS